MHTPHASTTTVTLGDVALARWRLAPYLRPTPLDAAPALGGHVWLKLECTNLTHSFKVRGALNALLALDPAVRARGVVAASSGNHAQGVAYAARLCGVPARVLMPITTPGRKVDAVRRLGAIAEPAYPTYDDAEAAAHRYAHEHGLAYISPYNDAHVVAGQGTIALEVLEALPDVARVVVCVGGGGLASGVSVALKALRPQAEVIGVCAAQSPALYNAFTGEHHPGGGPTLADALAGDFEPDSITLGLVRAHVDQMLLVDEAAIADAMRWCVFEAGFVAEGGGAVGVAALLSGQVPRDDTPTVVIVSGGNIDAARLRTVLCAS